MIKNDLFSLDIDELSIKYSFKLSRGTVLYCYICKNAHVGCKFHCERYNKRIETDEEIIEIHKSSSEVCKAIRKAKLKEGAV